MRSKLIFSPSDQGPLREEVGGKAFNLYQLKNLGLRVPKFFCLGTEAFKVWHASNKPSVLPQEAQNQILKMYDHCFGAHVRVSVRSSSISEDSSEQSYAGQYESFLNVERERVCEYVVKCFQSALTSSVQAYQKTQLVSPVAVVIQVVA